MKPLILTILLLALVLLAGCRESTENTVFLKEFCIENGYNQAEFKAKGEAVCWIVDNKNADIRKVECTYEEDTITECEIIDWDN